MSESSEPIALETIRNSPLWHLYGFNLESRKATFVKIDEATYHRVSFLDQRLKPDIQRLVRYGFDELKTLFPADSAREPLGFIFHVGHCGSTLLSRALASGRHTLPLREPTTLRTLANERRSEPTGDSSVTQDEWSDLFSATLAALSRTFAPAQPCVVKPTSTCNNLIAPLVETGVSHRALLMYVPLEPYLAGMLGKNRVIHDLHSQAPLRYLDWQAIDDAPSLDVAVPNESQLPEQSQLAVLSWLTSMNHFMAARKEHPTQVELLNFESLLADVPGQLDRVTTFFDLAAAQNDIAGGFAEVAKGYSKRPDAPYTPETRNQLLDQARREHAKAIQESLAWAKSLIDQTPALAACADYLT